MKKTEEVRELAYREYERHEGKISLVHDALKNKGIEVSERSIREWKKQGRWLDRMKRDSNLEQWLLDVLINAIEDCHKRLGSSKRMDSQSAFALVCLVRLVYELKKPVEKPVDVEEMQRVANEILEREYGIIQNQNGTKQN
ncbi:MAG: hypothetical protein HY805_11040 [Nitrospirae bacterium]|nr:hypothetical protein [Nitrospirota bacterium]